MARDLANCRIFAARMNGGGSENVVEWILLSVKGGNYAFGFPSFLLIIGNQVSFQVLSECPDGIDILVYFDGEPDESQRSRMASPGQSSSTHKQGRQK